MIFSIMALEDPLAGKMKQAVATKEGRDEGREEGENE